MKRLVLLIAALMLLLPAASLGGKTAMSTAGVNVMDFGARCNGSANDLAAIRSAVSVESAAGGGDVSFPGGRTCVVKTSSSWETALCPGTDNVRFVGGDGAVLKVDPAAPDGTVLIDTCGHLGIAVEGLTLDLSGHDGEGVHVGNSNATITGDTFLNGGIGVYLDGQSVHEVLISQDRFAGGGYGVLTQDASTAHSIQVLDSYFMGGARGDAIEINTPSSSGASDWTIANNVISGYQSSGGSDGFGIGLANAHNITITGNTLIGVANHGIHVEDRTSNLIISSNRISGNIKSAIYLVSGAGPMENFKIVNNEIQASGTVDEPWGSSSAIWLVSGGAGVFKDVLIRGNILTNNGSPTSPACAISVEATDNAVIDDNQISDQVGSAGHGICYASWASAGPARVSNNTVNRAATPYSLQEPVEAFDNLSTPRPGRSLASCPQRSSEVGLRHPPRRRHPSRRSSPPCRARRAH